MKYYDVTLLVKIAGKYNTIKKTNRILSMLSDAAIHHEPIFDHNIMKQADVSYLVNVKRFKKYEALFVVAYRDLLTRLYRKSISSIETDMIENPSFYVPILTAIKLFGNRYINLDLMSYDDMQNVFARYGNQFKNIKPFTPSQRNWEYGTNLYERAAVAAIQYRLNLTDIPKQLHKELKAITLIWHE